VHAERCITGGTIDANATAICSMRGRRPCSSNRTTARTEAKVKNSAAVQGPCHNLADWGTWPEATFKALARWRGCKGSCRAVALPVQVTLGRQSQHTEGVAQVEPSERGWVQLPRDPSRIGADHRA